MALTYRDYLNLDELLELQIPRSDPPEHDEYLFIIIHQVYELWIKQTLIELDKIKRDFDRDDLYGAIHTFKRVRMILKTMVGMVDILETMTPMSFSSFRDRLETASGFQSTQFRELEYALGYKRPEMLKHVDPEHPSYPVLQRRLAEPSVIDHFYGFLEGRGVTIPAAVKEKEPTAPTEMNHDVQRALLQIYEQSPDVSILLELMTDVDEGLQEWRYRHVKLVERTIGNKKGTGGSLGVDFLKRSLFQPVFPDLWEIRREL